MLFNLPKSFKKFGQFSGINNKKEGRIKAETFYCENSSIEVKIYDKKLLEQTIQFRSEEDIIRIEFVLKQFTRLFEKPYRKWQIENGNQLKNMITYHKGRNKRYWKSYYNDIYLQSDAEKAEEIIDKLKDA